AYLYIRQSTLRQVAENRESTQRQYALRHRALALGWKDEQLVVVDEDLGLSGTSSRDRQGFQRMVAEVSLGRVGLVMGLEVSRLARNNADWQRLLELCSMTETLILDEDGLYDPSSFNDRLLLGLKGTMSEAEIHLLRARLKGGILNKARRGELRLPLPVGYVHDGRGKTVLDPDERVRDSVGHLFVTFDRTGSAYAVVREFRSKGLLFPSRERGASPSKPPRWLPLDYHRVLEVLHNPRYAGAFVYGETRTRKNPVTGRDMTRCLPREEWTVFLPGTHEPYIAWTQYLRNQERLKANSAAHGLDRRHGPPRTGPALLQGLVVCGKCGNRMTVRYHRCRAGLAPTYYCMREGIESASGPCQLLPGAGVDKAIGDLLLESVSPLQLAVTEEVFQEIHARQDEVDRLHREHLEQAKHEAELAQRRFLRVHPDNRLVADTLEREWNEALEHVRKAEDECRTLSHDGPRPLTPEEEARIREAIGRFREVWSDPRTRHEDRKRMIRLLIEDVTLVRQDGIVAKVRFRGGATTELKVAIPRGNNDWARTPEATLARIRELSKEMTSDAIALRLEADGIRTSRGRRFTRSAIHVLRHQHRIPGPRRYWRSQGFLNAKEVAPLLGVTADTVERWGREGKLETRTYDEKGRVLFAPPGDRRPEKWSNLRRATANRQNPAVALLEVQYAG
ncbi:MAG: recombinase family protein, partial [Nitrososphaerales archaeon]